uniref:Retrovirus-related Pol polyprotein from transposon TNT 1-94 n=1 Tax=Cajanus cajan TaxID=3821 RepID=A0A151QPU6_CAJCA|nr:Retrovirus-related Pol polyprotein from transposon TNT 1-94 [Cajanus cajan]
MRLGHMSERGMMILSKQQMTWIFIMKHKNQAFKFFKERLALAACQDLELDQLDVKTTFLHGRLENDILIKQLEGFVKLGKEDYVCQLQKSLYGLKQSPRKWYKRFDNFMINQGFKRSPYDLCVYHKKVEDGSMIYLLLYVDDILITTMNKSAIQNLKVLLSGEFDMKNLGSTKKILGMEIYRDRSKDYIQKILHRFGIHNAKSLSALMSAKEKLKNIA